jgi:hypothetical protein
VGLLVGLHNECCPLLLSLPLDKRERLTSATLSLEVRGRSIRRILLAVPKVDALLLPFSTDSGAETTFWTRKPVVGHFQEGNGIAGHAVHALT